MKFPKIFTVTCLRDFELFVLHCHSIKKFLNDMQKNELKKFKNHFKSNEYKIRYVQMIDPNI